VQALAEMQRLEDAAAPKRQENDERATLLEPPHQVNAAIRRIQAECDLRTAPLDAILAKIACKDITPDPQALPSSASPVGGPVQDLSNFQMAPIPFLSDLTCSTHSPHDILKV
jgi:hypothetical protein